MLPDDSRSPSGTVSVCRGGYWSGDQVTGWADYQPYVPPHAMLHAEMTRKQAKESYEH